MSTNKVRDAARRGECGIDARALRRWGQGPLPTNVAHARPAGQGRPLLVPTMLLSNSVQPPAAEEAFCLCPPAGVSTPLPRPPAEAAVACQSPALPAGALQQRPPAASSRRLQGPPSPGTPLARDPPRQGPGTLFLTQACAPRRGSSCATTDPGALPPVPASWCLPLTPAPDACCHHRPPVPSSR
ncbi:uncharacterized protein [Manis javanica]|uniref:uncharacterized protein isoform X2 n=1 Tax=Manis javanica TaxID=9974 RepID=UPI003C6CD2DA